MSDWVDIVNLGLIQAGAEPLHTLTDNDTGTVETVELVRPMVVDAVLRAHPWNCAYELASLAAMNETPPWGWEAQYQQPTEPYCLRVLRLEDKKAKWKVSGRKILTNQPAPLNMAFIGRVTDPSQLDALVVQGIGTRVGANVVYKLSQVRGLADKLWERYLQVLREARSIDGQEQSAPTGNADEFLNARR